MERVRAVFLLVVGAILFCAFYYSSPYPEEAVSIGVFAVSFLSILFTVFRVLNGPVRGRRLHARGLNRGVAPSLPERLLREAGRLN